MPRFARAERQALADLLLTLGPDAPTMCDGWTTRDLAAHLVVRERRPDAAAGIVLGPLRGWGEKVRADTAKAPYEELVEQVRRSPWWSLARASAVDAVINTSEYFIHHEDVRRAQPDWRPREMPPEDESTLWTAARSAARLGLRKIRANVLIQAPGFGELRAGAGGPQARLVGTPAELLLFLSGRQRVARVQVEGPPEVADRLRGARLGF